jgi:hypothetical protein
VGVAAGSADFDGDGAADILTGTTRGAPHYRVVAADAVGVVPPAITGLEDSPGVFTGGLAVGV